jgi:DnaJ domain
MTPLEDMFFEDRPVKVRGCDHPGCAEKGDYRAPKDKALSDYYWFCLDHVRDYNKNWDYFAGMSMAEIENYIRKAAVWERPSWPMGEAKKREQDLRDHVAREFFGDGAASEKQTAPPMPKAEKDALAALELAPPVTFEAIKAQYRILVKRHHPDANGGAFEAEEKFKVINQAFTVLKQIYGVESD